MSLFIPQQRSGLLHHAKSAEELAWEALYRAANDPTVAAEVVQHFDSEPEARKRHLALYLMCRQTVRAQELRAIRIQRIAAFLQLVLRVLVYPVSTAVRVFRGSGSVALAMMPELTPAPAKQRAKAEPARKRVRRLVSEPEFAQAKGTFPASVQTASQEVSRPTPAVSVPPVHAADGTGADALAAVSPTRAA